jgi:hypothetical protein
MCSVAHKDATWKRGARHKECVKNLLLGDGSRHWNGCMRKHRERETINSPGQKLYDFLWRQAQPISPIREELGSYIPLDPKTSNFMTCRYHSQMTLGLRITGTRASIRFGFPAAVAPRWMPDLFQSGFLAHLNPLLSKIPMDRGTHDDTVVMDRDCYKMRIGWVVDDAGLDMRHLPEISEPYGDDAFG